MHIAGGNKPAYPVHSLGTAGEHIARGVDDDAAEKFKLYERRRLHPQVAIDLINLPGHTSIGCAVGERPGRGLEQLPGMPLAQAPKSLAPVFSVFAVNV